MKNLFVAAIYSNDVFLYRVQLLASNKETALNRLKSIYRKKTVILL